MERALRSRPKPQPSSALKGVSKSGKGSKVPLVSHSVGAKKKGNESKAKNKTSIQKRNIKTTVEEEQSFYDFVSTDESEPELKNDGNRRSSSKTLTLSEAIVSKPPSILTSARSSSVASVSTETATLSEAIVSKPPSSSLPSTSSSSVASVSSMSSSKISLNFYANKSGGSSGGEENSPQPKRKKVKLTFDVREVEVLSQGGRPGKTTSRSAVAKRPEKGTVTSATKRKKPLDKNMIDFLLASPAKAKRNRGASPSGEEAEDDEDNAEDADGETSLTAKEGVDGTPANNSKKPLEIPVEAEPSRSARKRVPLRCSPVVNSPPPKVKARAVETVQREENVDDAKDRKVETEGEFFQRFSRALESNSPKKSPQYTKLTPRKMDKSSAASNESGKKFFGSKNPDKTAKPLTSVVSNKSREQAAPKGKPAKTASGGKPAPKWMEKYKKMRIPKVDSLPQGRRTPSPLPPPDLQHVTGGCAPSTTSASYLPISDSAPILLDPVPSISAHLESTGVTAQPTEVEQLETMTERRESPSPDIGLPLTRVAGQTNLSVTESLKVALKPDKLFVGRTSASTSKPRKSVSFSPLPPTLHESKQKPVVKNPPVEKPIQNLVEGLVEKPLAKSSSEGGKEENIDTEEVEDIFGFGFDFVPQKSEDLQEEDSLKEELHTDRKEEYLQRERKQVEGLVGQASGQDEAPNIEYVGIVDGVARNDEGQNGDGSAIACVAREELVVTSTVEGTSSTEGKNEGVPDLAQKVVVEENPNPDLDISNISAVPCDLLPGNVNVPPQTGKEVGFNLNAGPSKPVHPFFLQSSSSAPTTSTPKGKPAAFLKVTSKAKRSPPGHVKKAFEVNDDGKRQMMLDLGQKNFGARQCPECDMVYTQNHPNDEIAHKKYHDSLVSSLSFPEWKKQRVVSQYVNGKIVLVLPGDPKYMQKKVKDIEEVMNQNLGFLHRLGSNVAARVYLYIAESRIVGCCIAQQITSAYKVIVEEREATDADTSLTIAPHPEVVAARDDRVYYCSKESTPACVGINRIWVLPEFRRKHVATRLLDSVRSSLIYGTIVEKDQVAFTDPTPDGRRLAARYTDREDFLVYNL